MGEVVVGECCGMVVVMEEACWNSGGDGGAWCNGGGDGRSVGLWQW